MNNTVVETATEAIAAFDITQTPLYLVIAALCAFCISVAFTPVIRVLAFKLGVTDVPKDGRRMHKKEMPLMGGLAIFIAFLLSTLIFCKLDTRTVGMLLGATLIVVTGIIDDKYEMRAIVKLLLQIAAAIIAVLSGIEMDYVNFFGKIIQFGSWSGLVTVVWIVALTNAINLIDGLDGLSCGISTISSFTLLVSLIYTDTPFTVIVMIGILAGSCLGFLPFNFNPAKIFMGDTGALFLGYTLSVLSITGYFKLNAIVTFWVPFLVFAIPLVDTTFAFIRRILTGRSPFSADRGHLHHRLIDRGYDQKHAVLILYAVSGISGFAAVLMSFGSFVGGLVMLCVAIAILVLNMLFASEEVEKKAEQDKEAQEDR
ncbi:MAG: undecaprenyl/decaprenyl-phosphate alpha-N-acetylglucosaminyl 1-phosphate transferase [Clostridia bacterium]|nr:undecaprenyl/decaprenyl-phosphate alpha-N-acetylglucosaminyl 1-phosphate transferase [Clostridia bacterium]